LDEQNSVLGLKIMTKIVVVDYHCFFTNDVPSFLGFVFWLRFFFLKLHGASQVVFYCFQKEQLKKRRYDFKKGGV
jgi:hypothetical protein